MSIDINATLNMRARNDTERTIVLSADVQMHAHRYELLEYFGWGLDENRAFLSRTNR